MSIVGFDFSFELVIFENKNRPQNYGGSPESTLIIEIISEIMLYINESPLLGMSVCGLVYARMYRSKTLKKKFEIT